MGRQIQHRVPTLGAAVLVTVSILMGLQAKAAARHQIIDESPVIQCGMQLVCHE